MANRNYVSAVCRKASFPVQSRLSGPWIQPTGRIDTARAAEILGFQEHDIPVLVYHGLLKRLANHWWGAVATKMSPRTGLGTA